MAHLYNNLENKQELEELIALLDLVDVEERLPMNWENCLTENEHPLVAEIGSLADSLLITSEGEPNWAAVNFVREFGEFDVFPVERDRFGWLVGGIQTSKGYITFG